MSKEKYIKPFCSCHSVALHGRVLEDVTSTEVSGESTEPAEEGVKEEVVGFEIEPWE